MAIDLQQFADDDFCYLTTVGRVSSRPHTIEIWFALQGSTLYMLAGGRYEADWVKNLLRTPAVQVRLRQQTFGATARVGGRAGRRRAGAPDRSGEVPAARQRRPERVGPQRAGGSA